ncbi:MAG: hypothetical protein WC865_01710 [Bacteroidales bacterium]
MDKHVLKGIFGLAFLAVLFFISGCDKQTANAAGVLEGVISIGPICPVEKIPPDPDCLPTAETYKAYPVSVWTSNGSRKIAQINPALDGSFRTELAPGNYMVLLEKEQNNIGSSNLPVVLSIISEDTTFLNINIDTGIR